MDFSRESSWEARGFLNVIPSIPVEWISYLKEEIDGEKSFSRDYPLLSCPGALSDHLYQEKTRPRNAGGEHRRNREKN